jgi:hypothetical protein
MKVTLLKPHTHAGDQKKPGDKIDVDADIAQWLADQGVIAPIAPAADHAKFAQEK